MTNFDILKRLSNLEKKVFGKKLDQKNQLHVPLHTTATTQMLIFEDDNEKHVNSNQFDCCGFRVIAA